MGGLSVSRVLALIGWGGLVGACSSSGSSTTGRAAVPEVAADTGQAADGFHKIQHVVVIMQENRSFDHYFGMYHGADGYTLDETGHPTNCVPDPRNGGCIKQYHD